MIIKDILNEPKMILVQISILSLIFLIFLLGVFLTLNQIFFYLIILLIICNLILGLFNKKKSITLNIVLLMLSLILFLPIVEYLATVVGAIVSLIYIMRFVLNLSKN